MTSALGISVKVLFQLLVNIVIAAFFLELVNVLAYWLVEKGHAYAQETGLLLVPPQSFLPNPSLSWFEIKRKYFSKVGVEAYLSKVNGILLPIVYFINQSILMY